MSKAFLEMSGVFAELELSMIRARVKSGMQNAREKGKRLGRRPTTKDDIPGLLQALSCVYVGNAECIGVGKDMWIE